MLAVNSKIRAGEIGGYLLGCRSDRAIIRQLTCDKAAKTPTDPDSRLATKSSKTAALPSYVLNGVMVNLKRLTKLGVAA